MLLHPQNMSRSPADARAPLREPGSDCQAISPPLTTAISVIRFIASAFFVLAVVGVVPSPLRATGAARFGDVVAVAGADLQILRGRPIDAIGALACDQDGCRPIPMQIDERDPGGAWVLDGGPHPSGDTPARLLDDNDELLFMATDAGAGRALAASFADGDRVVEIVVFDPLAQTDRRVYVFAADGGIQTPPRHYLAYDPVSDRFSGARVRMGFGEAVPTYTAIGDGDNILDRLKVRTTASLFWGWLRFSRDEGDLSTERVGWRAGPIRVIRHQAQQVRLGWGIRSPTFHSYTYFYRDFAELPVGLRLRVPATYFFTDISIEVLLDFRDLRGWRFHLTGMPAMVDVGRADAAVVGALNRRSDTSFALLGPQLSLVQVFGFSPSLESVDKKLVYREGPTPDPPESIAGSYPSVGYRLDRWDDVGAGEHGLIAFSYAVPVEIDVDDFLRSRMIPLEVTVHAFPR